MSCQSARRASAPCMLTSARARRPLLPLHTETNAHLHAKKRAREEIEPDGDGRRRREARRQARGTFGNSLRLRRRRRRRWCKRDVHNVGTVVEATLLVIREVSCGRTLQKRADWHSGNVQFGGKIPKHVRAPCVQRDGDSVDVIHLYNSTG